MKRLLPFIFAIFAIGNLAAQSIPNGTFSTWNNTTWGDPTGYSTSTDQAMEKNITGFTANVTEVAGWTTGINGVELTTELVGSDTIPAYINNAINNPLAGKGGIPYSQQPTKFELWYNSNEMTGDSGAVIIIFKKAGTIIGAYEYAFPGVNTGYPATTFTFNPPLATTPDSVIFAATSSIDVLTGKNGVPGSTFTISGLEFKNSSGTIINPTDLNGDFTSWVSDTAFVPTGWAGLYPGTQRTTDAYTGDTYALKLVTYTPLGNSTADPGFATTGTIENQSLVGGYPYTNNSLTDSIEFYYKYAPENVSDSAAVVLEFKTAGTITSIFEMLLGNVSTYTPVVSSFTLNVAPDSVIVSIYSSSGVNLPLSYAGTTVQIDNIGFASQQPTTGVKPLLLANNSILIYPNPASTQLTIAGSALVNEVKLVTILGQTILDKHYVVGVSADNKTIDISTLPVGDYFISVTSGNTTSTGKIVVNR